MTSNTQRRRIKAAAYRFLHWREQQGGAVRWSPGKRKSLDRGAAIEPVDNFIQQRMSGDRS